MLDILTRKVDSTSTNHQQLQVELTGLLDDIRKLGPTISDCVKMKVGALVARARSKAHRDLLEEGIAAARERHDRLLAKTLEEFLAEF